MYSCMPTAESCLWALLIFLSSRIINHTYPVNEEKDDTEKELGYSHLSHDECQTYVIEIPDKLN